MKSPTLRILSAVIMAASLIGSSLNARPVQAQSGGLVYVVQENETLYAISQMFHTSVYRLELRNYISDADVISPGDKLYIPGFDDLSGTLTPIKVGVGDTPLSLMRGNRQQSDTFNRINFLTSPDQVVIGQKMFTVTPDQNVNQLRVPITNGSLTGLEMAARANTNPWTAAEYNSLPGTWYLIANDILYLPSSSNSNEILPGVEAISGESALDQGKTVTFTATGSAVSQLKASLEFSVVDVDKLQEDAANQIKDTTTPLLDSTYALNFFQEPDGSYTALQGVPRMTVPGSTARLTLSAQTADGKSYSMDQNMVVKKVDYGYDTPLEVSDNTVDVKVTIPEEAEMYKEVAAASSAQLWSGVFTAPTTTPTCIVDTYGKLRSFNESDWIYWHSGTDYCGAEGSKVLAVANGTVVFTGELTVRGNTTIVDHGRGVYTAYYHQSKIEVNVGDTVTAGQEIGLIGATGRVTGPHLHLDVFVGGVQVDPDQWLTETLP